MVSKLSDIELLNEYWKVDQKIRMSGSFHTLDVVNYNKLSEEISKRGLNKYKN